MTELELKMLETEEQEIIEKYMQMHNDFCEKHNCFVEPIFQFVATPGRPIVASGIAYQAISKKRLQQQAPSNIILPNGKRPN